MDRLLSRLQMSTDAQQLQSQLSRTPYRTPDSIPRPFMGPLYDTTSHFARIHTTYLGFKFRSHFTAHCGRRVLLAVLLRADHLAPC